MPQQRPVPGGRFICPHKRLVFKPVSLSSHTWNNSKSTYLMLFPELLDQVLLSIADWAGDARQGEVRAVRVAGGFPAARRLLCTRRGRTLTKLDLLSRSLAVTQPLQGAGPVRQGGVSPARRRAIETAA
jgi:hypothetical protein